MRHHLRLLLPLVLLISSCLPVHSQAQIRAPLRVHPQNPRYFTDGSGKAIYLTGSHTWNNLRDWLEPGNIQIFDYNAYLDLMSNHNHNFMRMWNWDSVFSDPIPWQRPGPGIAADSNPTLDFYKFNQAYFDRLRTRVMQARDRGIYVGIMFFDGSWSQEYWDGHIFNPNNNIQGINGGGEAVHTLANPTVTAIQEAYVKKVIDTVNDLDNVLYEISNESNANSVQWQSHMINVVKSYEASKPKRHPVGMTATYPNGVNADLFNSPADWISPGGDEWQAYRDDPPPNDGRKVILNDTDHVGLSSAEHPVWAWKSFVRGLQPIVMDSVQPAAGDPETAVRVALGDTRRLATQLPLAGMTPRGDLASTGYALAQPGVAYVVFAPEGGEVSITVEPGTYQAHWWRVETREEVPIDTLRGGGEQTFTPPFAGAAVLWLLRPDAVVAMPAPRNLRLIGNNK
jgi:hypothetical protein